MAALVILVVLGLVAATAAFGEKMHRERHVARSALMRAPEETSQHLELEWLRRAENQRQFIYSFLIAFCSLTVAAMWGGFL